MLSKVALLFPILNWKVAGETIQDAIANAEDAKREWLIAAVEDGYPIPDPSSDESYSGQFKLRIPKSLHRQLAMQSKKEGISMNQYCLYLLSQNNALHVFDMLLNASIAICCGGYFIISALLFLKGLYFRVL